MYVTSSIERKDKVKRLPLACPTVLMQYTAPVVTNKPSTFSRSYIQPMHVDNMISLSTRFVIFCHAIKLKLLYRWHFNSGVNLHISCEWRILFVLCDLVLTQGFLLTFPLTEIFVFQLQSLLLWLYKTNIKWQTWKHVCMSIGLSRSHDPLQLEIH